MIEAELFRQTQRRISELRKELWLLERQLESHLMALKLPIWKSMNLQKAPVSVRKIYKVLRYRIVDKMTYEEIGRKLDVSRERIRQLEARGLDIIERLAESGESSDKSTKLTTEV